MKIQAGRKFDAKLVKNRVIDKLIKGMWQNVKFCHIPFLIFKTMFDNQQIYHLITSGCVCELNSALRIRCSIIKLLNQSAPVN